MPDFAPENCHQLLLHRPPALAFSADCNYHGWRDSVRLKLNKLVGDEPERIPPNLQMEGCVGGEGYTCRRLVFSSEPGAQVPCSLLLPTSGKPPYPVMICLQGHTTGAHISLGRPVYPGDETAIQSGDRDFAVQAVRHGYAALAIEQRCFGERLDSRPQAVRHVKHGCHHATLVSLLLGRSIIRERVWDVQRAIDVLESMPYIDSARIGCMGNSGGGTITWFAACLEPRITVSMPSCFVCSLRYSIGSIDHCADNYVPGMLKYFDLGDLACLIAPRPLVVVAGLDDNIFPIAGVHDAFNTIRNIYSSRDVAEKCRLVVGSGGHRFYASDAWPVFNGLSGWA